MNDKFTPPPWEIVRLSGQGSPFSIRMTFDRDKTFYGVRSIYREKDARLIAAAPDMFAALEFAERRSRQPEEGHTEYYERIAEEFFVQHGYLAPGKDDPVQSVPPEQRREAWEKFLSEPAEARRAALAKARGQITKTKDAMEDRR